MSDADLTPDLMQLVDVRQVRSCEPHGGERSQEGLIKQLTQDVMQLVPGRKVRAFDPGAR